MRYFVTLPGRGEIPVDVDLLPTGSIEVAVDGERLHAESLARAGSTTLHVGGRIVDLFMEGASPNVGVVARGRRFYAKVESERARSLAAALGDKSTSGEGVVTSPMPGRVLKLLVEEGAEIVKGTPLVVVEAMKMENELVAERDGVVKKIHVTAGQTVEGGAKLVEIE
jgi:biotin carboxyl carrier protein